MKKQGSSNSASNWRGHAVGSAAAGEGNSIPGGPAVLPLSPGPFTEWCGGSSVNLGRSSDPTKLFKTYRPERLNGSNVFYDMISYRDPPLFFGRQA